MVSRLTCPHSGHVNTESVTVALISSLPDGGLALQQRCYPRHGQQAGEGDDDKPEHQALTLEGSRISAWGAGLTGLRDKVQAPKRLGDEQHGHAHEEGPHWFQGRQVADPGAADAEREQHQRTDAADRRADGSQCPGDERSFDVERCHA